MLSRLSRHATRSLNSLVDKLGLIDFVMFFGVQRQWAKEVLTNEVLAIEGKLLYFRIFCQKKRENNY